MELVCAHLGVKDAAQSSLLTLLGAQADTDPQELALLPEETFADLLKAWEVSDGTKASPLFASRAGMWGATVASSPRTA